MCLLYATVSTNNEIIIISAFITIRLLVQYVYVSGCICYFCFGQKILPSSPERSTTNESYCSSASTFYVTLPRPLLHFIIVFLLLLLLLRIYTTSSTTIARLGACIFSSQVNSYCNVSAAYLSNSTSPTPLSSPLLS